MRGYRLSQGKILCHIPNFFYIQTVTFKEFYLELNEKEAYLRCVLDGKIYRINYIDPIKGQQKGRRTEYL